jgi:DNA mismatch repair ATPase MutS
VHAGPLALVGCRHFVLELLDPDQEFQPNDVYLAPSASLHIVAGANMGGKTTLLKQTALAVVAAQVGCFVPATFCSLVPRDRLLCRMGTGDSPETNSSSFMVEMQARKCYCFLSLSFLLP